MCKQCKEVNTNDFQFCPYCGHELPKPQKVEKKNKWLEGETRFYDKPKFVKELYGKNGGTVFGDHCWAHRELPVEKAVKLIQKIDDFISKGYNVLTPFTIKSVKNDFPQIQKILNTGAFDVIGQTCLGFYEDKQGRVFPHVVNLYRLRYDYFSMREKCLEERLDTMRKSINKSCARIDKLEKALITVNKQADKQRLLRDTITDMLYPEE